MENPQSGSDIFRHLLTDMPNKAARVPIDHEPTLIVETLDGYRITVEKLPKATEEV